MKRKIPHDDLIRLVQENPSITTPELMRRFGVTESGVLMHLHRAGYFKVWQKVQEPTTEGVRV